MAKTAEQHFPSTSMPDPDWWAALWPDPAAVVRTVGISAGDRVVDVCSGDGRFTVAIAQVTGPDGAVTAVELLPELIEVARCAVAAAGVPEVRFVQHDALQLAQVVEAPVDAVFMANTFHGVPDHSAFASVVHSVLRPGGRFVIVNWWPRPREQTQVLGKPRGPRASMRFAPEQLASWLEPAGLQLLDVADVGPYHYGASFLRP